jgi:hypothetical protein
MKAINKRPGHTNDEIERESVLLRAYGNGTHVLIDRDSMSTNRFGNNVFTLISYRRMHVTFSPCKP